jgi:hypothetical protein
MLPILAGEASPSGHGAADADPRRHDLSTKIISAHTQTTLAGQGRRAMTSDTIRPHHLVRKEILYIRQSSAHQVMHNRESGALQYAMRDRLAALGWSQIDTVDDDIGRSAAGGTARIGFERMVAEVCLGKVGR